MEKVVFNSNDENHIIKLRFGDSDVAFNPDDIDGIYLDDKKVSSIKLECIDNTKKEQNVTDIADEEMVEEEVVNYEKRIVQKYMKEPTLEDAVFVHDNITDKMFMDVNYFDAYVASYFHLYMVDERKQQDASDLLKKFYANNVDFCTNSDWVIENARKLDFFNRVQESIRQMNGDCTCYDIDILTSLFKFMNHITANFSEHLVYHFIYNVFNAYAKVYILPTTPTAPMCKEYIDKVTALYNEVSKRHVNALSDFNAYIEHTLMRIIISYECADFISDVVKELNISKDEKNEINSKLGIIPSNKKLEAIKDK